MEFTRFLNIARSSAVETSSHLQSARELGCLDLTTYADFSASAMEVRRMLGGLIKAVSDTLNHPRTGRDRKQL